MVALITPSQIPWMIFLIGLMIVSNLCLSVKNKIKATITKKATIPKMINKLLFEWVVAPLPACNCCQPASMTLNCKVRANKKTTPRLITSKALSATIVPTIFSAGTFSYFASKVHFKTSPNLGMAKLAR